LSMVAHSKTCMPWEVSHHYLMVTGMKKFEWWTGGFSMSMLCPLVLHGKQ
jgi:hypothetical protein